MGCLKAEKILFTRQMPKALLVSLTLWFPIEGWDWHCCDTMPTVGCNGLCFAASSPTLD